MLNTGVVKDERYLKHKTAAFHPESPLRLQSIYKMLEETGMNEELIPIEPTHATHETIGMVHEQSYIEFVATTSGEEHSYLDPDTETSPESYETAKLAAGGVCNAIDSVMDGKTDNAFAFVRPPGHHAEADRAAGFCIFNNIAIGALHAIKAFGIERVLIVDWDLHHGNGTQHSFYEDPRVLYFSTHQYPFYPGSGSVNEIGRGKGLGYTINVPLRVGPGDAEYLKIFRTVLEPVALAYRPDLVLLSAGFDTYYKDPLGGMNVTPSGFANLMRVMLNIADECCGGKLVAVLEGGYDPKGLTTSTGKVLKEMRGETHKSREDLKSIEETADPYIYDIIATVINQIKPLWQVFR
ncbi:MAG: histone deacetylase [Deltaproteobacteria bacterium]|nr:histone deacetylase [Deltaproteobacteria bacterium]